MFKIRLKNLQTAQGMVEFALVLPILLLLILGIFAFGHLFFVYSSVVSASREAARWGAAVGEAASTLPRYQDCASIRAAAARVGGFAGVSTNEITGASDTGVLIEYDHGPGTGSFDVCDGSTGGPSDVQMGDRILVTVRVDYAPIVPVVNIPSFTLEASSFRTILRSVPVGEAPTAVDPCTTTTTISAYSDPNPSKLGENVLFHVAVIAADGTQPTGEISVIDDIGVLNCAATMTAAMNGNYTCPAVKYNIAGIRTIKARFDSDNTCQVSSTTSDPGPDPTHEVLAADTQISLGVEPSFLQINQSMTVNISVTAPGTGITPSGFVMVKFPGQTPNNADRKLTLSATGTASTTYVPTTAGVFTITVDYPGDNADPAKNNLLPSTASINVSIGVPTPTFVNTSTPLPTVAVTPVKTPLPAYCPYMNPGTYDIFQVSSALQLPILNPNVSGAASQNVSYVDITWPSDPAAYIQEIRFGTAVDTCTTTGNPKNCLWKNTSGLPPTHQVISNSTSGWDNKYSDLSKGATKFMRMVFNHSMPMGHYHILIRFSALNCQIELDRDKVTP
jgi:hypothetical protein